MRGALAIVLALMAGGCAMQPQAAPVASVPPAAKPATPPETMQFLYGSGEAAALSEQAYNALVDHVRMIIASEKARPGPRQSVVLTPDATLEQPTTLPCGDRPLATVFDMDETAVLNLGYEYHQGRTGAGFDPASWSRWEKTGADKVAAVPGAERAFNALRQMGVTVIVNTNRSAASAAETEQALAHAGLGAFRHGDTLSMLGDVDGKSGKDARRAQIAGRYCVVAMGGDQLSDFTDLFSGAPTARRSAVQSPAIRGFFGRFWFVLPNPVYGSGLKGGFDDVFPIDKRWEDPGAPKE